MNINSDQKFFIWDAESVGLHGQTFAVAGGIYDIHGKAIQEFAFHSYEVCEPAHHELEFSDRKWVAENVTRPPGSREGVNNDLIERFMDEWRQAKDDHPGIMMFVECGWPVEARFLREVIAYYQPHHNWDGPYPLHEIATLMLAAGMDPMATYDRTPEESPAHEPLADARLSARLLSEALHRLNAANDVCSNEGIGPVILHFK